MSAHVPRHAPRHAAARRGGAAHGTRGRVRLRRTVGRPVVLSGAAAVIVAGTVALTGVTGEPASAGADVFALDSLASDASTVELRLAQADAQRVAADRSASNAQRSVVAARLAAAERAQAVAAAKARKEAAERAARAAEREKIIANAKEDPKAVARMMLPEYGWSERQWPCLDKLWIGESDWRWWAENPTSGAYGIPQSLPARKMATVGADYRTNPVTQIRWGLDYIDRSYGSPCNALDKWESRSPHWY